MSDEFDQLRERCETGIATPPEHALWQAGHAIARLAKNNYKAAATHALIAAEYALVAVIARVRRGL